VDIDLNRIEKLAIKAAYSAGKDIIKIYEQDDIIIELKKDNSPLTIADRAANSIIESLLKETQITIISEESNIPDYKIRKSLEYCWIVDPLDGTKEFIKRNGQFTVNIALIKKGNPVLGVVYAPALQLIYFTMGNNAYMLENVERHECFEEFWKYLATKKVKLPLKIEREKYAILASLSHLDEKTKDYIKKLTTENQNIEIINIGSSLKFCMIAAGKADIYPRFFNIKEWDTAAGHAIVKAAGGQVIDALLGLPLVYNKENLENPYFIAKI
jgi:3'(2'), 5'-bisphosphate nucleotidase